MANNRNKLSERIQILINENGLTVTSFAKMIGVTRPTVQKWINGGDIKSESLEVISLKFNKSTDWIIGITEYDTIRTDGINPEAAKHLKSFLEDVRTNTESN